MSETLLAARRQTATERAKAAQRGITAKWLAVICGTSPTAPVIAHATDNKVDSVSAAKQGVTLWKRAHNSPSPAYVAERK